jgi:hypothetical protein
MIRYISSVLLLFVVVGCVPIPELKELKTKTRTVCDEVTKAPNAAGEIHKHSECTTESGVQR